MGSTVKNPPAMQEPQETWVLSSVRKIAWKREWQPNPVFLPENPGMDGGVCWATVHSIAKSRT